MRGLLAALANPSRGDAWEPELERPLELVDVDGAGRAPGLEPSKSIVSGSGRRDVANPRKRRKLRRLLYALREVARGISSAKGVQRCGVRRAFVPGGQGPVEIRREAGARAFFAGLMRCASVWECPVCMQRIQAGRAEEVLELGRLHRAGGGALYLATLTIPHKYGERLEQLRKAVAGAWRRIQAGRRWLELKDKAGLVGSVRALEVTVGPNGWHPHLHVLLLTKRELAPGILEELEAWIWSRWSEELGQAGRRLSKRHGVTIRKAYRDDYVQKLARELVQGGRKVGRRRGDEDPDAIGHRTPLELLEDLARYRRPADLALWLEYAAAMKGARQLTYSQVPDPRHGGRRVSVLEYYRGRAEQTDLELAGLEEARPALVVFTIAGELWDDVVAGDIRLQLRLLRAAEDLPPPAAGARIQALLDAARGLEVVPF